MACSRRISTLIRPLFPSNVIVPYSTAHTRYLLHGRETVTGAYRPIDNVEDPEVQDVAKFAITEHNKNGGANLQFERVLEGETQLVAGRNFKLILAASSDRKPGKYEAVVYDNRPWENIRRLTSFRFIELFAEEYSVLPTGAYRPIDNVEDPKIQDVAKFAITEHNKNGGANLQFERVLEGETQMVAGRNYKLILAASSDRKPGKYEAVVYDRPWENIRRLTSFRFIELFAEEYSVLPDYSQQPPQSFPQKGFTLLGQMAHLFDEVHQIIEQLRQFIKGRGDDEHTDHNDRSSSDTGQDLGRELDQGKRVDPAGSKKARKRGRTRVSFGQ